MSNLQKFTTFTENAWESFRHLISTVRWTPNIYSKQGMQEMRIAAVIRLIANGIELAGPYFIGQLVAAHAGADVSLTNQFLGVLGLVWITGIITERYGGYRREQGWNLNDRAALYNLTREWFRKTPNEINEEDRTVGANQIESGQSSFHNLQFALFFRGTSIAANVTALTTFILLTDVRAGLAIVGVLVTNLVIIFYINHWTHIHARQIENGMRATRNQLIEYWKNAPYIIATGNEHTVLEELEQSVEIPWKQDLRLWGMEYAIVDGIRSCLTATAFIVIVWLYASAWDTATLTSIMAWLIVFREQFWQIAEVQREMVKDMEKIHPLREEFTKLPYFEQGAFINRKEPEWT